MSGAFFSTLPVGRRALIGAPPRSCDPGRVCATCSPSRTAGMDPCADASRRMEPQHKPVHIPAYASAVDGRPVAVAAPESRAPPKGSGVVIPKSCDVLLDGSEPNGIGSAQSGPEVIAR